MRFLVDQSVSRQVAAALGDAGHDAAHLVERGLSKASDEEILRIASDEGRVVVTQDTDFGTLLAHSFSSSPSVILFRMGDGSPGTHARILLGNLEKFAEDLENGAIVVVDDGSIRIRRLPISKLADGAG